jgi:hypothetical protein
VRGGGGSGGLVAHDGGATSARRYWAA